MDTIPRGFSRLLFLLILAVATHFQAGAQVSITEFLANNTKGLRDSDGDYSDWIELFNAGPGPVNLQGWTLTDDPAQPARWSFPSTVLNADGYLVVFASGKNRAVAGSQLHTSFSLDADGEYLGLFPPESTVPVSEFGPAYPQQQPDISFGYRDGRTYFFSPPSPGAANTGGFGDFVADTKFSHDRGFHDVPFDLTISTATAGAAIRYTTNGSLPTLSNGAAYTGPIPISRTTVIRAAGYKEGFQPSNVDTQTYLFLDDIIHQSADGKPPPGWPSSWGGNVVDYGMDPDVVNSAAYKNTIKNDLKTIPSFCLSMKLGDLFDGSTGIYANAGNDAIAWERAGSVELIYPDGSKGFQVNAGVRIRGGYSRSGDNPKHAFRFFFREKYGDAKLKYPLFGDSGTDTFDAIDLRTFQNYSWSFGGDSRGVFLRDQFSRDSQLDMGSQAERGNFYHLYINGQYWGLYNTCERPEASYGATYFGGNKTDYDVIKVSPDNGYTIGATDGTMAAWTRLYNAAKAGFSTDEAYFKVQGLNPDGTPNPAYENLIDVDNLIDYMLVIFYGGNLDAPISNFLGNTSPNNWFGMRDRTGKHGGFRFFAHDSEHTLLNAGENRTGPYPAGDNSVSASNPQWIFQKMWANAEFRAHCGDRIHRWFFNGGALTPEACRARFLKRKDEIDRAVVGESARWGDAKQPAPLTRDNAWLPAINNVLNSFFPTRSSVVLGQLKSKNLYPSVTAPSFSQHGGNVAPGYKLSITAPAGTIYYTIDGTDPRERGGGLSRRARQYPAPLTLNESSRVSARTLVNETTWSALNQADFVLIRNFSDLLITEIMYHPPAVGATDGDAFEFVELKNVGAVELDLSGVHFTNGISFTFPLGTRLGAGRFAVLVSDPAAFATKYPGVPITGVFQGKLSNSGERLTLVHAAGPVIVDVPFGDNPPWPESPDGQGFSLVPVNPNANANPGDPANWSASSQPGGSPGADDLAVDVTPIVLNEVLTHTDPPQLDSVELFNPAANTVSLGGWFLTDDRAVPKKFRVPDGVTIPGHGYVVFDEDDFNRTGEPTAFTFSSHGDEAYLYSADAAGNLTGYSDGFSFGASTNGVSFGRYTNSVGEVQFPAQKVVTMMAPNSGPRIGPVILNEIHYQPLDPDVEFVELKNISGAPVPLFDPAFPTNHWRLNGVGFEFPPNITIPTDGLIVITGGDPVLFRAGNGIPSEVQVFGPFSGNLQDNGELLELQLPDSPDYVTNGVVVSVVVPFVTVDAVRYDNHLPWPVNAAGLGPSLERINAAAYGNDPQNWRASPGLPSPGSDNTGNRPPHANAGADQELTANSYPAPVVLSGTATDDGLPDPPGKLSYTWSQVGGPAGVSFADSHAASTTANLPGQGTFVLHLTVDDGARSASDDVSVTIHRQDGDVTFVPAGATWKYLDNGSDQGTAWRAPGFSDAAWPSGKAQLGYSDGEGDEVTVLNFGTDASNKFITYYFRLHFQVPSAGAVSQLTARLVRDDGAVIWVNGQYAARENMPEGDVTFTTRAVSAIGGADESTIRDIPIDAGLLVDGDNVLAVEIHQANPTSSDISFDLALVGRASSANQASKANAGGDQSITFPASAALHGSFTDDGLPAAPGVPTFEWKKTGGPGTVTFINGNAPDASAAFSTPGAYTLKFSVNDGEFIASDEVTITVSGDDYGVWKTAHFTAAELNDPAISGDSADPDSDGHTNRQEYIAGTDPRLSTSVLHFDIATGLDAGLQFTTAAGKGYTVQYRDVAEAGEWKPLQNVPAGAGGRVIIVDDPPMGAARFYRVVTPQIP